MQSAARQLGLKIHILQASSEQDLTAVFAQLNQLQASALVISTDAFSSVRAQNMPSWRRFDVPAIFQFRDYAAAGGLRATAAVLPRRIAWPAFTPVAFSRANACEPACSAGHQGRVDHQLKDSEGARPKNSPSLLARADEVIE
jgi:putative ABC transport system substrate-binding protein